MDDPGLPAVHDEDRLEALDAFEILDTPPEPGFDDIVAIARSLCQAPVALISFVGTDRQWFKARSGFERCETPLSQSVCAHALERTTPLVIPDLRLDERTRDNALVTDDPFVRFYAGAPLVAEGGLVLGTLCVLDHVPRPGGLTLDQDSALQALARQVMLLLDLRRIIERRDTVLQRERTTLRESRTQVRISDAAGQQARAAQEAGRIGTFRVDLGTDLCHVSPELCRIFGLAEAPSYPTAVFEARVAADDRVIASTRQSRERGSARLAVEYRIARVDDDAVRWIARRGEFVHGQGGRPESFTGTMQDITERKLREQRTAALLTIDERLREVVTVEDAIVAVSRGLGEALGVARAGYAAIDTSAGTFTVEADWTAPGVPGLKGPHPIARLLGTLPRLKQGSVVVLPDGGARAAAAAGATETDPAAPRALIEVPLRRHGKLVAMLFVHSITVRSWSPGEVDLVRTVADRAYATVAKLRAESEQRLLNGELGHRLKNTLAMVQAIASQTLRSVPDRAAVEAFTQRLMALSSAHDVLLQQSWAAARIWTAVQGTLGLHGDMRRLDLAGPDLSLGPKAVLSLTMLLHELATNAVKYGAWSGETGRVSVRWSVVYAPAPPQFVLVWQEIGGPPVIQADRTGFGSRLIRTGLVGTANAVLEFRRDGLRAEFRAPVETMTDR